MCAKKGHRFSDDLKLMTSLSSAWQSAEKECRQDEPRRELYIGTVSRGSF